LGHQRVKRFFTGTFARRLDQLLDPLVGIPMPWPLRELISACWNCEVLRYRSIKLAASAAALATFLPASVAAQIAKQEFQSCLSIEDMTKERLDCFDALVPPEPRDANPPAKAVTECRFIREEDERLSCFNRFVLNPPIGGGSIVTKHRSVRKQTAVRTIVLPTPPARVDVTVHASRVRHGRGCGSRGGPGYRLPNGKCASRRH
jgi:hypothetical protein